MEGARAWPACTNGGGGDWWEARRHPAHPPIGIGSPKASPPGHSPQTGTFLTTATAANKCRQVVGAPPTLRVSTTLAKTTSARPPRTFAVTGGEDVTCGS